MGIHSNRMGEGLSRYWRWVLATTNGGNWKTQKSGTRQTLHGVGCVNESLCWAVGADGTILGTANGGKKWLPNVSTTRQVLFGISCPTKSRCYAVGDQGEVLTGTKP